MSALKKTLLAGLVASALAVAGGAIAGDSIKHKVIEVKALQGDQVKVLVHNDDAKEVIVLQDGEVTDDVIVQDKIAHLDEDTQQTILQALEGTRHLFVDGDMDLKNLGGMEKVIVLNEGFGELIKEFVSDVRISVDDEEHTDHDGKKVFKHKVIVADGSDSVLKGHTDAIVKLIERGEFDRDELDRIQVALDSKR